MPTIEKVYKNGYLEKCELKEDEYGFYLDLHFAGIDGKDKDLYIPNVRLGFNRNVAPVIIEEPIIYCNWSGDYDCKVELGPGRRYTLGKADGKVVAKTGEIVPFSGKKYIEAAVPEKDVYTFDEIAKAFDMISAVSLKEFLSKAKKLEKGEEKD